MRVVRSPALRIAMIGQRGVPATSGGIERHVEEIGARLVGMGHEVLVYVRPSYTDERHETYRGMQLRYVSTADSKHLEAIVHSAASTLAVLREHVDVVHYHALGPGLLAPIPRVVSRAKVVQTVHGLDQKRAKWGGLASSVLNLGGWTSARVPNATVVVSRALREHYLTTYRRDARYVCNGVTEQPWQAPGDTLRSLGVQPGNYVLFVGRLVPEKAPDLLVRAFRRIDRPDLKLVVVGASSYTDEYAEIVEKLAADDPRVVMAGRLHDEPLRELYGSAAAFVLPSDLEGMPLTLLEAAAEGAPLLASDIEPHQEMIGVDRPGRRLFRRGDEVDLARRLLAMVDDRESEQDGAVAERVGLFKEYNWDRAAEELSELYCSLHARRRGKR